MLIKHKLFGMPEFKKAKTILFYAPFDGEVDTFDMMFEAMKLGKKITLPKVFKEIKKLVPFLIGALDKDLEVGMYGIKEPKVDKNSALELEAIDMVVVPGVAFDKQHHRLGRGGGYYDRFLPTLSAHIPTVGLAFDFQVVERLPELHRHDVPVAHLLTNS